MMRYRTYLTVSAPDTFGHMQVSRETNLEEAKRAAFRISSCVTPDVQSISISDTHSGHILWTIRPPKHGRGGWVVDGE